MRWYTLDACCFRKPSDPFEIISSFRFHPYATPLATQYNDCRANSPTRQLIARHPDSVSFHSYCKTVCSHSPFRTSDKTQLSRSFAFIISTAPLKSKELFSQQLFQPLLFGQFFGRVSLSQIHPVLILAVTHKKHPNRGAFSIKLPDTLQLPSGYCTRHPYGCARSRGWHTHRHQ